MAVFALSSLLKHYTPQTQLVAPNPVLDHELRHVSETHRAAALKKYGLAVLLVFHAVIATVWIMTHPNTARASAWGDFFTYEFITLATIALTVSADIYMVLVTVSRIHHSIESGRWDLLRLTPLRDENIVAAEFAIAQVRVWRVMIAESVFRLTGLIFLVLLNLNTALTLLIALPVSLYLVVLVISYLAEPRWRMQTVVAFSGAIAMRISDHTIALLAALGLTLAVRLTQLLALGVLWYIAFRLLNTSNSLFCLFPVACLGIVYLFYAGYRMLERESLRRALGFAIQAN